MEEIARKPRVSFKNLVTEIASKKQRESMLISMFLSKHIYLSESNMQIVRRLAEIPPVLLPSFEMSACSNF